MVPKKNRLGSLFFKNFFKKGVSEEYSNFSVKYTHENKDDFGLSVVVSKKVSNKAVERNLLKRRFLSLVLEQKNLLLQGFSYVFYLKKTVQNSPQEEIAFEIEKSLKKIYEKNR